MYLNYDGDVDNVVLFFGSVNNVEDGDVDNVGNIVEADVDEVLVVMLMILAILLKAMLLTYLEVLVVTPVARSETRWSMECEENGKEIVGISLVSLCLP